MLKQKLYTEQLDFTVYRVQPRLYSVQPRLYSVQPKFYTV